jgi:hypothetical protein
MRPVCRVAKAWPATERVELRLIATRSICVTRSPARTACHSLNLPWIWLRTTMFRWMTGD